MRSLTLRQVLIGSLLSTLGFLALLLLFRFGFASDSEVTPDAGLGWLTGGVRLHPAYLGIVLLALALLLRSRRAVMVPWLVVFGAGLVLSDLIFHLLVLWPIFGDPELSLVYARPPPAPPEEKMPSRRLLSWTALLYVAEWAIRAVMLVLITVRPRLSSVVALTWLLLIFFMPWIGLVFYLTFGQSRLPPWRLHRLERMPKALAVIIRRLELHPKILHPRLDPDLEPAVRLATSLSHFQILGRNTVEVLTDYNGIIDRLVSDIDAATDHVHLLFYIFADDPTTTPVIAALERAVQRGVHCRVLFDAFGSKPFRKALLPRLRAAGIKAYEVLPVGLFSPKSARFDLRNHRKIVVIDGKIGYTGSQNLITAKFKEGLTYEELVVRVTGPVVLQLQFVFAADWYLEVEEILDRDALYPDPEPTGNTAAQVLPSGPGYPNLQRLLVALLYGARQRVVITTPYFIPDEPVLQAIETAVLRGVEVHLIVSKKMDQLLVGLAQRSYYEDLLDLGVKVHLYRDTFLHAKHLTFDDQVALIGSTNIDIRSFRLNAEVTLLCYDPAVTARLRAVQKEYFKNCEDLDPERWRRRHVVARLLQNLARLFSPLL